MDVLSLLTGSEVRADVMAALFSGGARAWKAMELERATGRPHSPVCRELRRLESAGLVGVSVVNGRRQYSANVDAPVAREIARLVGQARGQIPRIRKALVRLHSRSIAWVIDRRLAQAAETPAAGQAVIVLTGAPRSLVRVQLAGLSQGIDLHTMSMHEWTTRLQKGDVFLRRARRARKLWVVGTWSELVARERAELDSKRLLRSAVANWRDKLSDEWDEDWDPFASTGAAG